MKTKHPIIVRISVSMGIAVACAFASGCAINSGTGDQTTAGPPGAESLRPAPVPANRALAASPRYLEKHPELLRRSLSVEDSANKTAQIRKQLAKRMENRAVANSPRFLETHPEFLRAPISAKESENRAARIDKQLAKRMENRAWANSPRAREEFPELMRGDGALEIAPLK